MKPIIVIVGQTGRVDASMFGDTYASRLFVDAYDALEFLNTEGTANIAFIVVDPVLVPAGAAVTKELRDRFPRLPIMTLHSECRSEIPAAPAPDAELEEAGAAQASGNILRFESARNAPNGIAEGEIFVHSGWGKRIRTLLPQVAKSDASVLLQGETGVGKEVVARWLHSHSQRAHKPFLKVNCAALPAELIESELFGYERGAFTGAVERKPGKFELARNGTVFLDEIGDMDICVQAKLL
jgi:DNA-binding NtrC family response regulator